MAEYTLMEMKKEMGLKDTDNFNALDFWYWFLAPNKISLDTKVHLVEHTTVFSDLVDYMKECEVLEGEQK